MMRYSNALLAWLLGLGVFLAPMRADAVDTAAATSAKSAGTEASAPAARDQTSDDSSDPIMRQAHEIEQRYAASVLAALSASADPRDWAIAGVMKPLAPDAVDPALTERARLAAPNDALVQWIALRASGQPDSKIDQHAALLAVQRLEPDNADVWMEPLAKAVHDHDNAAIEEILAKMATGKVSDEHFADVMKALLDVHKRYPLPAEYLSQLISKYPEFSAQNAPYVSTMAIMTAMWLPAYQNIIKACTVDSTKPENSLRATQCAAIGRLMANRGTILISNRIGWAILARSGTYTDDDVKQARIQDWIYQRDSDLQRERLVDRAIEPIAAKMDDWWQTNSELESMRREILRAGESATPPEDWADDQSPLSPQRLADDRLKQLAANQTAAKH